MKPEEIKQTLKAFYDGRTTRVEEKALQDYFDTDETGFRKNPDGRLFAAIGRKDGIQIPDGLEQKLSEMIDARAGHTFMRKKKVYAWVAGIAASLLVAGVLGTGLYKSRQPQDTFTDPEQAYAVVRETLTTISENLNKGTAGMEYVREELHQTAETLQKQLQQ